MPTTRCRRRCVEWSLSPRVWGPTSSAVRRCGHQKHAQYHAKIDGAVVTDRRTHDHEIFGDRRRRGHLIVAAVAQFDIAREIHLALRAKATAKVAGLAIDCQQAAIDGADEDA